MKEITLVLINNGANVGTYSPYSFKESFTGNIDEKVLRCRSFDDDGQEETNLYCETKINIPEWMDEQFYLSKCVGIHWAFVMTAGWAKTLSQQQLSKLLTLDETYQYFIGWLFKGNTKNTFKLEIRALVEAWLSSDSYKYKSPLSNGQFDAASKFCKLYEAKQISNNLYNSRAYWSN